MRDLTKPDFIEARISVNRAFDAWCHWQQRLRSLINEAETYSPEAFEVSLKEVRGVPDHDLPTTSGSVEESDLARLIPTLNHSASRSAAWMIRNRRILETALNRGAP